VTILDNSARAVETDAAIAPGDAFREELIIKEARRRQRRRRFTVSLVLVPAAVLGGFLAANRTSQRPQTPASLLARPLHFPALHPGSSCPASSGRTVHNGYFNGVALGSGPVRVLIGNRGDLLRGQVNVGTVKPVGWGALETLWFSTPRYKGPFVVRGRRLGGDSRIEVQPGSDGREPGSGPLIVSSGPTLNTRNGYRTVPGSTWVTSPGCYAWQVDGSSFSEIIVMNAVS
jgi:hypothetical protein